MHLTLLSAPRSWLRSRKASQVLYTARCYDEIPAKAIYEMDSGERRTIECKSGIQQGNGMGPPLFCFALVPIDSKLRSKYEPTGVRITAYMDDINLNFK